MLQQTQAYTLVTIHSTHTLKDVCHHSLIYRFKTYLKLSFYESVQSIYLPTYLFIYSLSTYKSSYSSIYLPINLSTSLSIYPSTYPSTTYLSIYPNVYMCLHQLSPCKVQTNEISVKSFIFCVYRLDRQTDRQSYIQIDRYCDS